MAQRDLRTTIAPESRKLIKWRVIVGSLGVLISLAEWEFVPQNRSGADVVLILVGSLLYSGLPVRQPRWWLLTPGLMLLYPFFFVIFVSTLSHDVTFLVICAVMFGLPGALLVFYGVLRPKPDKVSK